MLQDNDTAFGFTEANGGDPFSSPIAVLTGGQR